MLGCPQHLLGSCSCPCDRSNIILRWAQPVLTEATWLNGRQGRSPDLRIRPHCTQILSREQEWKGQLPSWQRDPSSGLGVVSKKEHHDCGCHWGRAFPVLLLGPVRTGWHVDGQVTLHLIPRTGLEDSLQPSGSQVLPRIPAFGRERCPLGSWHTRLGQGP